MNTSYTIQMASKISGVGVHTIRAWEKRYKALVPERDSSGHRVYSKSDIEKLMLLSELCLLGYSISKVANFPIDELKKLLIDLGKTEDSLSRLDFNLVEEKVEIDWSQSLSILMFAIRSYKLDVIAQELQKLKQSLSGRDFALEIVVPLYQNLQALARQSALNQVQIESIRALINVHLSHFLSKIEKKDKIEEQILICSVNAFHEWEAKIIGVLLQHHQVATFMPGPLAPETLYELVHGLNIRQLILVLNKNDNTGLLEKLTPKNQENSHVVVLFDSGSQFSQQSLPKNVSVIKDLAQLESQILKKRG